MDRRLAKELQFHVDRHVEDLVASGLEPAEARRRARLAFGGSAEIEEACRDERSGRWVEDFVRDLRHGLRLLRRSPVFAGAAILSLALGIGANTAIFSLMDLLMLRRLPVREPDRLVQFQKTHPEYGRGSLSYPAFLQFRQDLRSLHGIFAVASMGREIRVGGAEERASLELVSGNYFDVLGVPVSAGRTFHSDADAVPGASPVAVICDGYWKRRYGADHAAIGKTFEINRTVFTIIGVTPPEFFGAYVGRECEIMIPVSMDAEVRGGRSWLDRAEFNWLSVMGRLRPGVSLERAEAEARTIFARSKQENVARARATERSDILRQSIDLIPAGNGFDELRNRFSEPLAVLMGLVALVLLIACANLANLLLAKSASRRQEIALRLAIGAGRGRIVRQMMAEGLLLATIGGALGVLIALNLAGALVTMMSNGDRRIALSPGPDLRVLAFAAGASILGCLLFSLAPALHSTRAGLQRNMAEARTSGRWRLGRTLIVAQVAISLFLLVAAGLFGRTLWNLYSMDAGFQRQGLTSFSVNMRKAGYAGERVRTVESRIVEELSGIPGVESASLVLLLPVSGGGWDGHLVVGGYTHAPGEDNKAHLNLAGPHYFRTMRTPVIAGREFDERDGPGSPRVAVVNETFARYYFKGRSAVGGWLAFEPTPAKRFEIVGVVKDMTYRNLRQTFPRTVYFPSAQSGADGPDWHSFVIRSKGPAPPRAAIAAAVQRVDAKFRVPETRTIEEHIARSMLQERMLAALAAAFGLLALVVAALGIYGVMAFQVARRRREIGVRLALGARPADVTGMVLGDVARLLLPGAAIGLAGALALSGVVTTMMYGIKPTDPLTLAAAAAVLALVAMAAAWLPGRAAARLNPVETLRCE